MLPNVDTKNKATDAYDETVLVIAGRKLQTETQFIIPSPFSFLSSQFPICQIAAGRYHAVALNTKGEVYGWGVNRYGCLGIGHTRIVMEPTLVEFFGKEASRVRFVSAGERNSGFITNNGELYMSGFGKFGCIGNDSIKDATYPTKVKILDSKKFPVNADWDKVAIGDKAVLGIVKGTDELSCEGDVYSWGDNVDGLLGSSRLSHSYTPINITDAFDNTFQEILEAKQTATKEDAHFSETRRRIVNISVDVSHCLALGDDHTVFSWGNGSDHKLGHGSTDSVLAPKKVKKLHNIPVIQVCASSRHSVAVDSRGYVWTWGNGEFNQLGQETTSGTTLMSEPERIQSLVDEGVVITSVSSGYNHNIALSNNGDLYSWGDGSWGKLINSLELDNSVPTKVQLQPESFYVHPGFTVTVKPLFLACGVDVSYVLFSKHLEPDRVQEVEEIVPISLVEKGRQKANKKSLLSISIEQNNDSTITANNYDNKLSAVPVPLAAPRGSFIPSSSSIVLDLSIPKKHVSLLPSQTASTNAPHLSSLIINNPEVNDNSATARRAGISRQRSWWGSNVGSSPLGILGDKPATVEFQTLPWKCKICSFQNEFLLVACAACRNRNPKKENPPTFATSSNDKAPSKEMYYLEMMKSFRVIEIKNTLKMFSKGSVDISDNRVKTRLNSHKNSRKLSTGLRMFYLKQKTRKKIHVET